MQGPKACLKLISRRGCSEKGGDRAKVVERKEMAKEVSGCTRGPPKRLHTSDEDGVEPKRNGVDQLQSADAIVQLGRALQFMIQLLLLQDTVLALKIQKHILSHCLGQC